MAFFQNADEIDKRSNQLDEESYQVEKIMGVKTKKGKKTVFGKMARLFVIRK